MKKSMKNSIALLILLLSGIAPSFAQPLNRATLSTMLKTAEEQMDKKNYYKALEWYQKAYDDSKDRSLVIHIADLNYMLRDYKRAERRYAQALRRDKNHEYSEKRFEYARCLKMNEKYEEAIGEFDEFIATTTDPVRKELAESEKEGAEFGLRAREVMGVTITNAGKNINTKNSEYSPFLVNSDDEMYYSSLIVDEIVEIDEQNTDYQAKILTAKKGDKGWGEPTVLGQTINRPDFFNSNVRLSDDGRRMYFTRQKLDGNDLVESKIFMSEKGGNGWGPANEVVGINGDYIAKSPAVGDLFGKEVLYFTSDMEGGEGGYDIYYATYKGDGVYGDPVNLGPKINTVGDEDTPFYRDGMLYFSSTGHPGLGGYDIFQSPWNGVRWGKPKNMGKGYNSSVDDLYFMIDKEGYHGFLASNRPVPGARSLKSKTCCNDIYNVSLKKIEVSLVASTYDEKTKEIIPGATVQLIMVADAGSKNMGTKTNKKGNNFDYPLELDKTYRLIATHPNFDPDTIDFNTVGLLDSKIYDEKLFLKPLPKYITISKEEPFVLQNIFYDFDDDKILPTAEPDLKFILELMTEYPKMVIELGSHTDFRGDDSYNRNLSQRRAESARRWLLNHSEDITRRRIIAKGYGESVPKTIDSTLASNHPFLKIGEVLTEDFIKNLPNDSLMEIAHQINRRTEFKIVEGPTSIKIEEKRLIQIGNRTVKENIKKAKDKQTLFHKSDFKKDSIKIHQFSSLFGKKNLKGVPIMQFDQRSVDFGKMKKGDKREHVYIFKNVGDVPLDIDIVNACECTTTEYTIAPVKPGETGYVKAFFDSAEKETGETIDIDIILKNTEPDTGIPIFERVQFSFEIEE